MARFQNVLTHWIDKGVDGFYLKGVEYLGRNEDNSKPDWSAISEVIGDIRKHIDRHVNQSDIGKKIALFASLEDATEGDKKLLTENGLDTIINRNLAEVKKDGEICGSHEGNVAKCVYGILSDVLRYHEENPSVWPQWE
ncbi:hypothetical protein OESDEN_17182, partial [Oesophagostomum dentatum]